MSTYKVYEIGVYSREGLVEADSEEAAEEMSEQGDPTIIWDDPDVIIEERGSIILDTEN